MRANRPGYIVGQALEGYVNAAGMATSSNAVVGCDIALRDEMKEVDDTVPDNACYARIMVSLNTSFDMGVGNVIQDVAAGFGIATSSATSTPPTLSSILGELMNTAFGQGAELTKAVFGQIVAKVAVVGELFASHIHAETIEADQVKTKELCIDDICVTRDQFYKMIQSANAAAGAAASGGSTPSPASAPTPAPDNGTTTPEGEVGTTTPETGTASTTVSAAPVIHINGANPAMLAVGDSYSDLGASVTDDVDQNLGITMLFDGVEVQNISLDTSTPGTHVVTYTATDSDGTTTTVERTITIQAPITGTTAAGEAGTTTPPIIDPTATSTQP
jgi:hypothetical protein